jgi:Bacteriophage replication gene A protein (GPA)
MIDPGTWLEWSLDRWAERQTDRIPAKVAAEVLLQRRGLIGQIGPNSSSPFAIANRFLMEASRKLLAGRIWSAYDEGLIRDCAESWARAASVIPQLTAREEFARWHGITPPARKHLTDGYEECAARLADPHWWRRGIRKAWTRASENAVRELGVVRKGKMPYASDDAVSYRAGMKRAARGFQENAVLVNELGDQLGLFGVAQKSIANPALRRGEFMTRVRGFEELADFRKDVALFFTLTAPSRYHCQLSEGGKNPKFYVEETDKRKRETVRSAQAWLCQKWANARAALHRRGIVIYGFRIAEPHHDATPHWHGLFFCPAGDADTVSDVIAKSWLKDSGDEPGARKHRVNVEIIDKAKGSATGYIAKYVAKNIDGHGTIGAMGDGETGSPVSESLARVDAWAAIHGIRQFQQIGGPPVGLWREARRLREEVDDVDIERVRRCADRGDWRGFCRAVASCGEVATRRTSVRLWKEETGERSKYGDCRPARVIGLQCSSVRIATRPHRWEVRKKGQEVSAFSPRFDNSGVATAAGASRHDVRRDVEPLGPSLGSSLPLGPVAITVRCIPGTLRMLRGRPTMMTVPGQPGIPPVVFVDEQSRYQSDLSG